MTIRYVTLLVVSMPYVYGHSMSTTWNPLDDLGLMPDLPRAWESMPVQQDITRPLEPGFRWPLTVYPCVEVAHINAKLLREGR